MVFLRKAVFLASVFLGSVGAFAPNQQSSRRSTSALDATKGDFGKKAGISFVAAAYLLANVASVASAFPVEDDFFGSSQVISRSGGRAGGRSSAARTSKSSSTTNTIHRTTVIHQAPSVVVAPPVSYGYDPTPGLGLSVGLSAINSIGEGMREARQENEIRDARAQAQEARVKNAELEARLRQLEMQK